MGRLSAADRVENYKKQNGSDKLTPRQKRRIRQKSNRDLIKG